MKMSEELCGCAEQKGWVGTDPEWHGGRTGNLRGGKKFKFSFFSILNPNEEDMIL